MIINDNYHGGEYVEYIEHINKKNIVFLFYFILFSCIFIIIEVGVVS